MNVYQVQHLRPRSAFTDWPMADVKVIGYFSSLERAEAAVAKAVALQGFRDFPSGFEIREVELDQLLFPSGFDVVADRRLIP